MCTGGLPSTTIPVVTEDPGHPSDTILRKASPLRDQKKPMKAILGWGSQDRDTSCVAEYYCTRKPRKALPAKLDRLICTADALAIIVLVERKSYVSQTLALVQVISVPVPILMFPGSTNDGASRAPINMHFFMFLAFKLMAVIATHLTTRSVLITVRFFVSLGNYCLSLTRYRQYDDITANSLDSGLTAVLTADMGLIFGDFDARANGGL